MADEARIRLFELACEAAFLIATDANPAVARQRFLDDLTDELVAGRRNLEAAGPALRAAFREAMGYSRRVDALGERGGGRGPLGERDASNRLLGVTDAATPPAIRKDAGPSRSPSAPGEDTMVAHGQLRVIDGGET